MRSPKKILTVAVLLILFVGGPFLLPIKNPPHVQLPAEILAGSGMLIVTNTMTAAWASIIVLAVLVYFGTRKMKEVPGRLQALVELLIEFVLNLCTSVAGPERARKFFALCATLFLFILMSNWMGLLPGYGTIGVWHDKETSKVATVQAQTSEVRGAPDSGGHESERVLYAFFRSANTDLNTTIALALISVIATQVYGFRALGIKGYASRFLNFSGPIDFFVGFLETVSEIAKIISLSFRLFGNVFAGEVLLAVMAFLVPWIASVPFMGLEMFVGVMQAFVFMMLTLVFLTIGTTGHGAEHGTEHSGSH